MALTDYPQPTHALSEKSSFWGDKRDYWHYLSEGVGEIKALDSVVKIVQAQSQVCVCVCVCVCACVHSYACFE